MHKLYAIVCRALGRCRAADRAAARWQGVHFGLTRAASEQAELLRRRRQRAERQRG